jgi:PAS domain S-box-containing protein
MNRLLLITGSKKLSSQLERALSPNLEAAITVISDLAEAVELLEHDASDLILVDAPSLHIDGLEVCDRLHQSEEGQRIPIMLLAPSDLDSLPVIRALSLGPGEVFTLPAPSSNLIVWIKVFLQLGQARSVHGSAGGKADANLGAFTAMLDQCADPFFLVDSANGKILFTNAAAHTLTGYQSEDLMGKICWDLFPVDRQETVRKNWSRVVDLANEQVCELPLIRRSGMIRDVVVALNPCQTSQGLQIIVSMRESYDLSRGGEPDDTAHALGSVDEFLSVLGHEVRNPLTAIGTNVQYMQMAFADSETQRDIYQDLMFAIGQLDLLFREIVDYTHPMELRFEPVKINEMAENVFAAEQLAVGEPRKYSIKKSLGDAVPEIRADKERLHRALEILFERCRNGVTDDGVIRVQSECDTDSIRLTIAYDGTSLSARDVKQMFTPVGSLKSRESGLGMALARRILDDHQCRLEVSSDQGGKTQFEVTFPLQFKSNA